MNISEAEIKRRLRGVVLELVYENHMKQAHRLDDLTLWGVLDRLQFDVCRDDVRTICQDLCDRGYLTFDQWKDRDSGRIAIMKIQITPAGRDLVEDLTTDKAVQVR